MITETSTAVEEAWPALPLAEWKGTCATLHMWSQIVGKVRLELSPLMNHWWEVPFYLTARGLTTSPIPYGTGVFEMRFDFIDHRLNIETSWGENASIHLVPRSVAAFYHEFMNTLRSLGIEVQIWPMPVEVPNPIRFDQDEIHGSYDADHVHAFWRVLITADTILKEFRARFIGKDSPVHFFWGSFDLAVSRFSGRDAPERQGVDRVTREAYSHEVSSAGFWPGSGEVKDPAFYSYTLPEPAGFRDQPICPGKAFYHPRLHEFILMYDDLRASESPKEDLLEFLQTTYEAGATLGNWNRAPLERSAETVITPGYATHCLLR
ncbi:MAG TPA: DUF5996 family protein [Verrucomicrobiae bacterium]|nr:DUF5996 family protein [Verrucomicrobiae bacterium]